MSGGDRTGPNGYGPMTGRGAGYCAGYTVPGFANPVSGRGGFGRGRGFFGRGRGFRHMYYAAGISGGIPGRARVNTGYFPFGGNTFPGVSEIELLKQQAQYMSENLNAANERIRELEQLEAEKEKPGK